MQSRLTPSSLQAKTLLSATTPATLSVRFLTFTCLLLSALQFCSEVSKQRGIYNKKTSEEGPSREKLLLFTAPTPMEKMAVAYDVFLDNRAVARDVTNVA